MYEYTENPLRSSDQIRNTTMQESDDISVEILKTRVEEKDRQIEEFKDENAEQKSLSLSSESDISSLYRSSNILKLYAVLGNITKSGNGKIGVGPL